VVLAILAIALGGRLSPDAGRGSFVFLGHFVAAIVIAVIEEAFFRAFLLAGMRTDFGRAGAVVSSSVVYALAHLLRSPARFYVEGLDATAGARSLAGALANVADPHSLAPIIGLFLIGLVLGEGFNLTGTVYFSIGMHAGLIVGLRSWRETVADRGALPGWLFGYGRFPLVSGVGGWLIAAAILALIRPLARWVGRRDGGGAEAGRRPAPSRAGAS
jgi:CAAX prenyl protease-like protein